MNLLFEYALMELSTLWLVAALMSPLAPESQGDMRTCANRFEIPFNGNFQCDIPLIPTEDNSLPLLFEDEEAGEEDDLMLNQGVFQGCASLPSSSIVLRDPLPSPCPVLSTGAARSPPSA